MPRTNTSSANAHTLSSVPQHHHSSHITSMAVAIPVEQSGITTAELMREEVEAVCSHMLWLYDWWQAHEEGTRAADRTVARSVQDHFVDRTIFEHGISRATGLDMNEQRMREYSRGRSAKSLHSVVGGAA